MFFRNTIKSRVLEAINKKIADAEALYEDKCLAIDNQLDEDLESLRQRAVELEDLAESNKTAFADLMVNDILKKII